MLARQRCQDPAPTLRTTFPNCPAPISGLPAPTNPGDNTLKIIGSTEESNHAGAAGQHTHILHQETGYEKGNEETPKTRRM